MNQACLYHRSNEVQRYDAEEIIQEFSSVLQWRYDGHDSLLDVGSGSGDVLMDFIYPLMPLKFEKLVGTDISAKMIAYAEKCYKSLTQCDFKVLDIGCESWQLPKDMTGKFDHVTSFYCLHWVQNQSQALANIYNLLRPEGGDCLLVFLASNPIYDVYKLLSTSSKWSAYMKDVDKFISPLHYSKDPKEELTAMLRESGFSDFRVDIREKLFIYEGLDTFKDNVKAICPFLERLPNNRHQEFMNDLINIVASLNLSHTDNAETQDENFNELSYKFSSPYKLVVAYAKKAATPLDSSLISADENLFRNIIDIKVIDDAKGRN